MAGAAWWLATVGPQHMPFTCVFHELSGLHCPGCGMTRAAHAVFEGRIFDAIRFNPLGMILLPLALLVLSIEVFYWVLGRSRTWSFPLGTRGAVGIALAVILFGILRNLPWWPLTLLAPS